MSVQLFLAGFMGFYFFDLIHLMAISRYMLDTRMFSGYNQSVDLHKIAVNHINISNISHIFVAF